MAQLTTTKAIQDNLDKTFVTGNGVIIRLWFLDDMSDQLNVVFSSHDDAITWVNGLDVSWSSGKLKWSMMHGRLVSHSI